MEYVGIGILIALGIYIAPFVIAITVMAIALVLGTIFGGKR